MRELYDQLSGTCQRAPSFLRGHTALCALLMWEETSLAISQEQAGGELSAMTSAEGRELPSRRWGGREAVSALHWAVPSSHQAPGFSYISFKDLLVKG